MNPNAKMATGAQCSTLAGMVAVALTKKFEGNLTFSQAQISITDKKQLDVNLLAEKFANEIFGIYIDLWSEEKAKISHFYKTCFKDKKWKNPDWEHSLIPGVNDNLKRLEFIFIKMTEQEAFNAYLDYFGKDNVWKAWDDITKNIDTKTIQQRPKQNYPILHVGGDEPDLLNKSYDDGISENIIFMTPLEGIISAFRYRFETGKMYDVIGLTRLSALGRNGDAVRMCRVNDGRFSVDSRNRVYRNSYNGLRQVVF
jgi:hypothetical protein